VYVLNGYKSNTQDSDAAAVARLSCLGSVGMCLCLQFIDGCVLILP